MFPSPSPLLMGSSGGDPYWGNVVLLCGFEGANNSTAFADESSKARALTANGNAKITTTSPLIGTSSLTLDGTGDFVSALDSDDFWFGTGPFTIELFVNFSAVGTDTFVSQWGALTNNASFAFYLSGGNTLRMRLTPDGTITNDCDAAWTPSTGVRYHLCAERDASNVVRTYVDGVMKGKTTLTTNIQNASGTTKLGIGSLPGFTTLDLAGLVDEVRITKGVARYGSDVGFTPPTTAYPRF